MKLVLGVDDAIDIQFLDHRVTIRVSMDVCGLTVYATAPDSKSRVGTLYYRAHVLEQPWFDWEGGPMPVSRGTLVDIRHRDGCEYFRQPAGEGYCNDWDHKDQEGDIMAYRICEV